MPPVSRTAVGWAYPNDRGNANLHFFRNGRSLCWKWDVAISVPKLMAEKIRRLRDFGWVCERCWRRRSVAIVPETPGAVAPQTLRAVAS